MKQVSFSNFDSRFKLFESVGGSRNVATNDDNTH